MYTFNEKRSFWSLIFFSCMLLSCGNDAKGPASQTKENSKPVPASNGSKPVVQMVLDGKAISSDDYNCSWVLTKGQNIFNLTVFYDRKPQVSPARAGFNIYKLKDIAIPLTQLKGLPSAAGDGQFYSLSASAEKPAGKPSDMNEISFTDNYPGLTSMVQITKLDTMAKIVSGRFEGSVKNANGREIRITGGSFENISIQLVHGF